MRVLGRALALVLLAPASMAMADTQLTVEAGLNCAFGADGVGLGLFAGSAFDYADLGIWWDSGRLKPTAGAAARGELRFGKPMRFSVVGRSGLRSARRHDGVHYAPYLMGVVETGLSLDTAGEPAWLVGVRTGLQPVTSSAQLSYGLVFGDRDLTIGLGGHVGVLPIQEPSEDELSRGG